MGFGWAPEQPGDSALMDLRGRFDDLTRILKNRFVCSSC